VCRGERCGGAVIVSWVLQEQMEVEVGGRSVVADEAADLKR